MCLILFSWCSHPGYRLILAANRDEFYNRPTKPAAFWADYPDVLAGRDLEQGGTWLGVTKTSRFAALTNYRDPKNNRPDAVSRGHLVKDFLCGTMPPSAYLNQVDKVADNYNGFNLLVGDSTSLWYYSNKEKRPHKLAPGLYGLSNGLLDNSWPKVKRGKHLLCQALTAKDLKASALLNLLEDRVEPPETELPDTGVDIGWEKTLSPIFIHSPNYGTRASTVLMIEDTGKIIFHERSLLSEAQWTDQNYVIGSH
ncbi:MAG: hypothetical protein H6Q73_3004 [Firmicutes bacterium]|nr:hypothetical protein [Bacillota bacterium]